jgi:hypothetical protein
MAFCAHDVPMCPQRIDPREWDEHGGAGLGDIDEWSNRACGMGALWMILLARQLPAPALTEMLKLGAGSGGLTERGWLHSALAALAADLGLPGQAQAIAPDGLPARLKDGPLIASVTSRFPDDGRHGGHLVVLRGCELGRADPLILFRDPSQWGQEHDRVPLSRLAQSSTGRCITFTPAAPSSPA